MAEVAIFCASHRPKGNSYTAALALQEGYRQAGLTAEILQLSGRNMQPCQACGLCAKGKSCPIQDDIPQLFHTLLQAKTCAFTSPIYFYALPSLFKTWIDRSQFYWERKVQGDPLLASRPAMQIPVCFVAGQEKGEKLFEGARLTLKYFLANFNMQAAPLLTFRSIDARGDLASRPDLLEELTKAGLQAGLQAGQ